MADTPSQVLLPLGWHSELMINELGRPGSERMWARPAETEASICFVVVHAGSSYPPCKESSAPQAAATPYFSVHLLQGD